MSGVECVGLFTELSPDPEANPKTLNPKTLNPKTLNPKP